MQRRCLCSVLDQAVWRWEEGSGDPVALTMRHCLDVVDRWLERCCRAGSVAHPTRWGRRGSSIIMNVRPMSWLVPRWRALLCLQRSQGPARYVTEPVPPDDGGGKCRLRAEYFHVWCAGLSGGELTTLANSLAGMVVGSPTGIPPPPPASDQVSRHRLFVVVPRVRRSALAVVCLTLAFERAASCSLLLLGQPPQPYD